MTGLSILSDAVEYLGELWPILKDYGVVTFWLLAMLAIVAFVPGLKIKVAAAIVAVMLVLCTLSFSVGIKRANDLCAAEQLRAERAAEARDKLQGSVAETDDDQRLAEIVNNSKTNQERFHAFKAELAKHRDNTCRLNAADRLGLRLDGERGDTESCGEAAGDAKADDAGSCAAVGRDAKAVLADTRAALAEANARLAASAAWYEALRRRYRAAPLR